MTSTKAKTSLSIFQLHLSTIEKWECHQTYGLAKTAKDLEADEVTDLKDISASIVDATSNTSRTCLTCDQVFQTLQQQQDHFKSPLHHYNLKRKARLLPCVQTLPEQNGEDSSESSSDTDKLDEEEEMERAKKWNQSGKVCFVDLTQKLVYQIYANSLFGQKDQNEENGSFKPALENLIQKKGKWVVILLRSGRFAGGVFAKDQPVVHKVFQRYTTRRKQGGSQSASDQAAGSKAKSAGAQLRRYNEAELKKDIRSLLLSWKEHIDSADRIFLAVGRTSRSTFFGGDKPLLDKQDTRVTRVPFGTQRPNFQEVCRVHKELTSISSIPFVEPEKRKKNSAVAEKKGDAASKEKQEDTVVEAKEVPEIPNSELVMACLEKDYEKVNELLKSVDINWSHPTTLTTALHEATDNDDPELVKQLLENGADPTLLDVRGRPPFFLAKSKASRDTYRRYRGMYPDQWDYDAARVPDALTDESEEKRKAKEREKKKKARARKKQNKQLQDQQKQEQEAKYAVPPLSSSLCDNCRKPLQLNPFERLQYKYCSTECVTLHKRILVREAALKRLG